MALEAGQKVWLTAPVLDYPTGKEMAVKKVLAPMKGVTMVIVHPPEGGRSATIKEDALSLAAPGGAAAPPPSDDELTGPVIEFLESLAPMEEPVTQNFVAAYVAAYGTDNLDELSTLIDLADVPMGEAWTIQQMAQLSLKLSELRFEEPDPEARKIIPAPAAPVVEAPKAVETPAAVQPAAEAPKTRRGSKGTAQPPEPRAGTPLVDRDRWNPTLQDALRLAGVMLPVLVDCPDKIDEVVELAVRAVKRAFETRQT